MKKDTSQSAAVIAGGYLLLTLAAVSYLVQDGGIGHGNAPIFVLALALTSPLSVILLRLNDLFSDVNTHGTGWPFFIILCELGAGALVNARLLYSLVAFVRRKWYDA